ncbi:DUF2194 domain-containing protein [Lachnospiraceae bacterium ZAX-1]
MIGILILIERKGLAYTGNQMSESVLIPKDAKISPAVKSKPLCLVIYDSTEPFTQMECYHNICFVLDEMRVAYSTVDTDAVEEMPSFLQYETVVFSTRYFNDVSMKFLYELFAWVEEGGNVLFANPIDNPSIISLFAGRIGIKDSEWDLVSQNNCSVVSDFLTGAKGLTMQWDSGGEIERLGGNYKLDDSCMVHMKSTGSEGETAMVWEKNLGRGKIIVNNNDAIHERWSRGLISAEYSRFGDVFAWPVINASVFFMDDFPAPIPEGYNEYVDRDYGLSLESFFVNVWFPDILKISKEYHIKYTGGLIETYADKVTPPFERNLSSDRMDYFGKRLLNEGGEIAVHGYNHQSIVPVGFDYKDRLSYNQWESMEDASQALDELTHFGNELFKDYTLHTYVPPSNVLSTEGRRMIAEQFPEINTIAGIYIDDFLGNADEFGIDQYGLITLPRVASGYDIGESIFWFMISEVNLHFVNTHFVHPDDVVDLNRGADKGWEWLKNRYIELISWLSKFPMRNMTAQEGAGAVSRFDKLTLSRTVLDNKLKLSIGGFYDEAWFLVRINEGTVLEVAGGTLTNVEGNLYLLKADDPNVLISLEGVDDL